MLRLFAHVADESSQPESVLSLSVSAKLPSALLDTQSPCSSSTLLLQGLKNPHEESLCSVSLCALTFGTFRKVRPTTNKHTNTWQKQKVRDVQKVQSSVSVPQLTACGKKLLPRRAPCDLFLRCCITVYFLTRPTWRLLVSYTVDTVCFVAPCHRCHVFFFCFVFIKGFLLFKISEFSPRFFSCLRFVIKAERMSDTVRLVDWRLGGKNVFALPRDICCAANVYKNLLNRCYPTLKNRPKFTYKFLCCSLVLPVFMYFFVISVAVAVVCQWIIICERILALWLPVMWPVIYQYRLFV